MPGPAGRGPAAGGQPVQLGAAGLVEVEAGPEHLRAPPAFGNAPPPVIAVSKAVRRAAARPSRSTRSSSLLLRHVGEEGERHVHLVGLDPAELARVAAYVEELVEVLQRLGRRHQRGEQPHQTWVPRADPIA